MHLSHWITSILGSEFSSPNFIGLKVKQKMQYVTFAIKSNITAACFTFTQAGKCGLVCMASEIRHLSYTIAHYRSKENTIY
jgi:hypothetical protein